jgi:(S)-mandelate dehydrogenase
MLLVDPQVDLATAARILPDSPSRSEIVRAGACQSIAELRLAARRALPKMVFDYLDGGAQTESTVRANREAFDRHRLVASGPVDVHDRNHETELFGRRVKMPIIIGPTGYASAVWPKGDIALARVAGQRGIPFVISNGMNSTLEEVANAAEGWLWFQIYITTNREITANLLNKAVEVGIDTIEVTVDTAVPGRRLRDIENGFTVPFSWSAGKVLDVLKRPRWAMRSLKHGAPKPGLMELSSLPGQKWENVSDFVRTQINPSISWDDLKWLRDQWKGTLIVKGLLDPAHMAHAIEAGFDGVVISNHGGRQLDGAVATLDMLPEFVAAGGGRMPILIDSGFRSGTDVLKALALGAQAVQLGRPTLFGLATAGEAGVDRALSLFQSELDQAMALTGLTRPSQASTRMIRSKPFAHV